MLPGDHLAIDASFVKGARTQKGTLVVRPQFAVFLATEASVNALATIAGGTVAAMAGFAVRVTPAQYKDVPAWLAALSQLEPDQFDQHLWHAAQTAGLWCATPQDAKLLFKKVPLFDRWKLWIKRGDENCGAVFGVPGKLLYGADALLAAWPRP